MLYCVFVFVNNFSIDILLTKKKHTPHTIILPMIDDNIIIFILLM